MLLVLAGVGLLPSSAFADVTIQSVTVTPSTVLAGGSIDVTVEALMEDNGFGGNDADWQSTNIALVNGPGPDTELLCSDEPDFNNDDGVTESVDFLAIPIPMGITPGIYDVRVRVFDGPGNECDQTPEADEDEDTSQTLEIIIPTLQLTKTGSGPVGINDYNAAGQTLNYNFEVENIGGSPVPGPIVIDDDLTANETCPALTTIGNFDANLDPGEIVNCSASYITVAGDVTNGYVVNCATASGDGGAATSNEACSTQGYDLDIRYDLMLCIDGSGSISGTDFTLQLDGTHAGLDSALSPDFLDSSVRVTVIQYSNTVQIEVGPTIIDSQATLDAFGTDISNISQIDSSTNTGGCIEAAYLVSCPAAAIPGGTCPDDQTRRIIDLSTDGVANVDSCGAGSGPACALQRAQEAQAIGIDVGNAIGVGAVNQQNLEDGVWPQPAIVFTPDGACDQPNECPESGDEGFVVLVDDFSEYQPAIEAKLIAEISQGFLVFKDFSDNNAAAVDIAFECGGNGTITVIDGQASEGDPAEFQVNGYTAPISCTATEVNATLPPGYTKDETDCANVDIEADPDCTIVNTLNSGNFTVTKDFSDDSLASVSVNAVCTSGTVTNNPQSASEASPAVFIVEGFTPGATCTATEVVPAGYTADQTDCADGDPIDGSCQIVNTLNTGNFTVTKDFSDDSVASVSVTAVCSSGTVTNNPQNASEASPAVFNVEGFTPGATCTATETVPPGYTADQTDCADNDPINGSCEIVNTLNAGSFTVTKDFSDDSVASVSVTAVCSSGTVTNNPQSASEASPAVFNVEGFAPGTTCTATESVPAGYTADQTDCADNDPINGSCQIVNTLNTGNFTVTKDFSDDSVASVTVNAVCTSGTVTNNPQSASEASPAVFTVEGFTPGATCTATEVVPAGYTADQTDCADGDPIDGSCGIVNTLNTGNFTVTKDFSDDSVASVVVNAVCTSGTVTNNPQNASEASPAVFTVEGFTAGATCTATETVPTGYTADQTDCADGDPIDGSCQIVNTLNAGNFTVTKDFSDDSLASVTVNAVCTSGTVTNNPQSASEASPAVFTVEGFTAGATCTATEVVPAGYTADQTDCADGDPIDGSCEIVNTLNAGSFTVTKDFSDDSLASVSVTATCSSGTVTNNPQSASEASPAVFSVEGFAPGTTCTATETVPAGYTADQTDCADGDPIDGSCEIVNTLNTGNFTVTKDFSDDNVASVSVTAACTSGTVTNNPQSASEASPAVFTVEGFTPGATCTATEVVPAGYTADQTDCADGDPIDGSCGIVNTLNTGNFTVTKDFSDDSVASVVVNAVCTSGTVTNNPQNASEASPAVFTVEGFTAGATCTATETVPTGYTADQTDCADGDPIDGSCEIVNTLNSAAFTVAKTYDDGNTTPVDVGLVCDSGTVTVNVGQATPGGPNAQFTVEGFTSPVLCTATESNVPAGYTTDNSACVNVNAENPGTCTITNTLNTTPFTVAKTYDDGNTTPVDVGLVCDSGTVVVDVGQATPGGPDAQFTVEGFTAPVLCTATESNVPAGYTTDNTACINVNAETPGSCTITNTLNTTPFTVAKTYDDGNTTPVDVGLVCDSGTVVVDVGQATPGGPNAQFTVEGFTSPVLCTATESNVPAGYTTDNSACVDVDAEDPGACTITNTLNTTTFTVAKTYDDGNTTAVDIGLVCDSGTVTVDVGQATPGGPDAQFTVEGYTSPVLCTATESNVPAGYTTDNSACVDVDAENPGSCTITNTLNEATFTVIKDFTDDAADVVEITLVCSSGAPETSPLNASEGNPALFNVQGYSAGATCTATESNVPVGYATDNSDCVDVDVEADGECTITNIPNAPDISLDKTGSLDLGGNGRADPGDLITYSFEVDNTGNVVLDPVVVTDPLPGMSAINCDGDASFGPLAPNDPPVVCTATYPLTQNDIDSGFVYNLATATGTADIVPPPGTEGTQDVQDQDDHFEPIGQVGGLNIDKSADPDSYTLVGDQITYTFTVENTGNVTLFNVEVSDPLITDPPNSGTISCAGEANPIVDMAPGEVVVCTGVYTVTQADIDNGQVVNAATVTGECPLIDDGATEGTVGGQENCPPSDEDDEIVEHEPGATTFRVQKDFSDDNPMNVMVSITCNTGLPLYQEAELSEFGNPFDFIEFIVGDFLPGTMDCSIEELIPAGYEPTYTAGATTGVAGSIFSDDDGCHYEEIEGGQFTCDIYNELLPVEVVVEKEWIDENPGYQLPTQVEVTLYCSEPIQGGFPCLLSGNVDQASGALYCSEQYIDPNNPGVWTVFPHYEGTDCWATEEPIAGVITDESDCEELTLFPGQGDSCLIVNTRIYAGIPTLSQYGLMLMALLMLGFGAVAYRRFV